MASAIQHWWPLRYFLSPHSGFRSQSKVVHYAFEKITLCQPGGLLVYLLMFYLALHSPVLPVPLLLATYFDLKKSKTFLIFILVYTAKVQNQAVFLRFDPQQNKQ